MPVLLKSLKLEKICPEIIIVGEPTEMNIVTSHKGGDEMRTEITGFEVHSCNPSRGVSAISAAMKIISKIEEIDIIKALFPGGSVTGAPKEKSMRIIDRLENYSRDIYTGSIGYIQSNGDSIFNIAIRTMTIIDNLGIYPVGGGIIWDSDPKKEWEEAQLKSQIITNKINEK